MASDAIASKSVQEQGEKMDSLMDLLYDSYHFDDVGESRSNLTDYEGLFTAPEFDLMKEYERMCAKSDAEEVNMEEKLSAGELLESNMKTIKVASEWDIHFTEKDLGDSVDDDWCKNWFPTPPWNGKREKSESASTVPIPTTVSDAKRPKVASPRAEAKDADFNTGDDFMYSLMVEKGTQKQMLVKHRRGETVTVPPGYELGSVALLDQEDSRDDSSPSKPVAPVPGNSSSTKKLASLNDLMQSEKQKQLQIKSRIQYQQRSFDPSIVSCLIKQENGTDDEMDIYPAPQPQPAPSLKNTAIVLPSRSFASSSTNSSLQRGVPIKLACKFCTKTFPRHHDHALRVHMIVFHSHECNDELLQKCVKLSTDVRRCKKCKAFVLYKWDDHKAKCMPSAASVDVLFEPVGPETLKSFFLHKCGICQETFGLKYELKNHVQNTHTSVSAKMIMEPFFRCAQCLLIMKTSEDLGKHCILCTDQQPREDTIVALAKRLRHCDFCEIEHESILKASACYISKGVFRCILCLTVLKEKETIYNHLLTYHLHNGNGDALAQNNVNKIYCPICRYGPGKYSKIFPHIVQEHFEPALAAHLAAHQKQMGSNPNDREANSNPAAATITSAQIEPDPLGDSTPVSRVINVSSTNTRQMPTLQPIVRPVTGTNAAAPAAPRGTVSNPNRAKIKPTMMSTSTTPSFNRPRSSVITPVGNPVRIVGASSNNQVNPSTTTKPNIIRSAQVPPNNGLQQSPQTPIITRYWSPPPGTTVVTSNNPNTVQHLRIQGNSVQAMPLQITLKLPPPSSSGQTSPPVIVIGSQASSPLISTTATSSSFPISVVSPIVTPTTVPPTPAQPQRIVVNDCPPDPLQTNAPTETETIRESVGMTHTVTATPNPPKSVTATLPAPVVTPAPVMTNTKVVPPQKDNQQPAVAVASATNTSEPPGPVQPSKVTEPSTSSIPVSSGAIPKTANASLATTSTSKPVSSSSSLGTHQSSSGMTAVKHTSFSKYGLPGIQTEACKSIARMLKSKPTTPEKHSGIPNILLGRSEKK